jgi:hypothetical protein
VIYAATNYLDKWYLELSLLVDLQTETEDGVAVAAKAEASYQCLNVRLYDGECARLVQLDPRSTLQGRKVHWREVTSLGCLGFCFNDQATRKSPVQAPEN